MDVSTQDLGVEELFARLYSPEGVADPYSFLRRFRGPGGRHSFALKVLHDKRFDNTSLDSPQRAIWRMFSRWLIALQGSDHAQMRALAMKPFARHLVNGYADTIRTAIDELLDEIEASPQPVDLVAAYAHRVPFSIICSLMDIPETDRSLLGARLAVVIDTLEHQEEEEYLAKGDVAVEQLNRYFESLLSARSRDPGKDLLSILAVEDVPLETLLANAIFLMIAGHATTSAAISACLKLLLEHPGQLAMVREHPDLCATAFEETLRFESPVQITERTAREAAEVDGLHFSAGAYVPLFIGAANRDPEVFRDPDRFDITRDPNPHLAFTAGPHFCIGAPLARLDGPLAVRGLLERFPSLKLAAKPSWRGSLPLRVLKELRVAW